MNCYLHPETPASAFCRSCGRPLCALCQRTADGTVYCQDHVPVAYGTTGAGSAQAGDTASNPYYQPPGPGAYGPPPMQAYRGGLQTSPALAFILGWIPGVGAIYNGQYLKGLVHAVIFGLLVSVIANTDNGASEPFLGLLIAAFEFYMPFEAYHTAKKRQMGMQVEEWSSLMGSNRFATRTPIGPIILIAIGIVFLLDTLHVVAFRELGRFWPVLLIVVGAWMLYARVTEPGRPPSAEPFNGGTGPTRPIYPQTYTNTTNASGESVLETRHEQ